MQRISSPDRRTKAGPPPASDAGDDRFAVVIPAYNEEKTIRKIVEGALAATATVIVVDDGCEDRTTAMLQSLPVQIVDMGRNCGKGAALRRGFAHALAQQGGIDGVVTIDGDGQHRPEDITALAAIGLRAKDKIVIGSRLHQARNFPPGRLRANRIARFWISWAAGARIEDTQSGFRFYPAALLREIAGKRAVSRGFAYESEILILAAELGFSTLAMNIPALYAGCLQRPSHFRPLRDITVIVLMVAWKLICGGMRPFRLYRSLQRPGGDGDKRIMP